MKENTDYYALPARTQGVAVSILAGAMLAGEFYKRRVRGSLPWALVDRCIVSALGRRWILNPLMKRPRR